MTSTHPVFEVLCSNHPGARPLMAGRFEAYGGKPPVLVPVDITDKTVESVVRRLLGSMRPGGTDLVSLQHYLLWFGKESVGIRQIVGEFGEWMANGCPPWAAYRALMLGQLIVLYKCSGIRPVGVGDTWRRMLAKCVL